jgi:hypothetical protein
MQMIPVESSNLKEYGYDPETKTLRIRFLKNFNFVYEYADVPQEIVDGLAKAESKGSYIAKNIVKKFEFKKVEV